jgi:hypothetical protein
LTAKDHTGPLLWLSVPSILAPSRINFAAALAMNLGALTALRRFLFFFSLLLRALLFSIKYRDPAFKVGFLICSQNYSSKCGRTDLLFDFFKD